MSQHEINNPADNRTDNIPIVSMHHRLGLRAKPGEVLNFDYDKFHETVTQVSGDVDYSGIEFHINHTDTYPVLTTTEMEINYKDIIPRSTAMGRAAITLLNIPLASLLLAPHYRHNAHKVAKAIEENAPYLTWDQGDL